MKFILQTIFLMVCLGAYTQEVEVKDPVFRQLLCDKYPLAMNGDCSMLDTLKAESMYPSPLVMNFSNDNIASADEVLYFKNADTIRLNFNQLTIFPVDLSGFRSLVRLHLANNLLKVAPDIKYTNPISGDTIIKLVYLQYNMIDSLPPSWFNNNGLTQVIDLNENLLDTIPDFNTYNELRRLDLRNNYLKFDELIPLKNHPRWATSQFDLFPQKEFLVYDDMIVEPGETLTLDFNTGNPGDSYILLKDNSNFITSNDGLFVLNDVSVNDVATYWVKIRNEAEFPDQSDFLKTTKFTISLKDEDKYVDETEKPGLYTFSPDGDGQSDFLELRGEGEAVFYDKNGKKILIHELPFDWDGKDQTGKTVTPGLYIIQMEGEHYLKVVVAY